MCENKCNDCKKEKLENAIYMHQEDLKEMYDELGELNNEDEPFKCEALNYTKDKDLYEDCTHYDSLTELEEECKEIRRYDRYVYYIGLKCDYIYRVKDEE